MRTLLRQKINELTTFAETINEHNTKKILMILSASLLSKQDDKLAGKLQEYAKDVLLPEINNKMMNSIANSN